MRARVVNAHDDLLPYRPVVLHLGVLPFVTDPVRVRVVLDHCGGAGGAFAPVVLVRRAVFPPFFFFLLDTVGARRDYL